MSENIVLLVALSIIQGVAEWLPISSSGHLILFERLSNLNIDISLIIALHLGTLLAVILYFHKDIIKIIKDFIALKNSEYSNLGLQIIIATIPAALAGFLLKALASQLSSNLYLLALGFAITALILIITGISKLRQSNLNYKNSILIGIAQIFAIFPGISRLGITISIGILSGIKEKQAIKFSFLLSIPITLGSILLSINEISLNVLAITIPISLLISLPMLHLAYTRILINKQNLKYFGFYLLLLAVSLLIFALFS